MPIHAPKILVFGAEPLNVIGHHRDPQKAPPWPKPHLRATANFGADRSHQDIGRLVRPVRETKKSKKERTRNKSNDYFESMQYRQDMRHIAHYNNRKNLACLQMPTQSLVEVLRLSHLQR